jgi:hypothetical protein
MNSLAYVKINGIVLPIVTSNIQVMPDSFEMEIDTKEAKNDGLDLDMNYILEKFKTIRGDVVVLQPDKASTIGVYTGYGPLLSATVNVRNGFFHLKFGKADAMSKATELEDAVDALLLAELSKEA